MRNLKEQFLHHSVSLVVGIAILLTGAVVHDTFVNTDPPFYSKNDRAIITTEGNTSVFRYYRDLWIEEEFLGEVTRHLNPKNAEYPQYVVMGSKQVYKPNTNNEPYKVDRPFAIQPALKPGLWCLHATMYWRPTFSLKTHSKEANPVCAESK